MITMISLLWRSVGGNKALPYILMGLGIFGIFVVVYWQGLTKGKQSAATEQLKGWLNRAQNDAQRRADIESLSSAAARDKLRKRWKQQ